MKRIVKYPLAVMFALLMGYSQVFAYGACPTPEGKSGSEAHYQLPASAANAVETAVIGEVEEDEEIKSSLDQNVISPLLGLANITFQAVKAQPRPQSSQETRSGDSYLRFRVIRL